MYNIGMNSKLISKLLNYAKVSGFNDLAITKHQDHHALWADDGLSQSLIKLPLKLENNLAEAFRQLLQIAPDHLLSGTYFKTEGHSFLISIIPHENGEKIIIKRIEKSTPPFKISRLGLDRDDKKIVENFLTKRQGLIIVASPANEGKTSTLFALLRKIDINSKICYLLEEHSEQEIDGINSLVGQGEQRLADLENVRRHDSEVIAIDDATETLTNNSLSLVRQGKFVLLGIKADNFSDLKELLEKIGTERNIPTLVIFQKLVAKNCPYCLQDNIGEDINTLVKKYWTTYKKYIPKRFFTSQGCKRCNYTGKKGSIAVFSIAKINGPLKESIKAISSDILQKAASGLISINKFIRKQTN